MQDTDNDVESDPTDQKPARPIEAVKHKHATHNRKNPNEADPNQSIFIAGCASDQFWDPLSR